MFGTISITKLGTSLLLSPDSPEQSPALRGSCTARAKVTLSLSPPSLHGLACQAALWHQVETKVQEFVFWPEQQDHMKHPERNTFPLDLLPRCRQPTCLATVSQCCSKTCFRAIKCCFWRPKVRKHCMREAGRTQALEVQTRISPTGWYHYLWINELDNLRDTQEAYLKVLGTKETARYKSGGKKSWFLKISWVNYLYALMERANSNISISASAHTWGAVKNHQRCETAVSHVVKDQD